MTPQDKEIFFFLDQLPKRFSTRKLVSLFESSKRWTKLTDMLHRGAELTFISNLAMTVSTSNTVNHNRITKEQVIIIQTLQAQMEEMCQKGIEDQRRNEEGVRLLKEHNKELKQQLDGTKQEQQSRFGNHTHN